MMLKIGLLLLLSVLVVAGEEEFSGENTTDQNQDTHFILNHYQNRPLKLQIDTRKHATNECFDQASNCQFFVRLCFEREWKPLLEKHCRLKCGFCVPSQEHCKDLFKGCSQLKHGGFCKGNLMRIQAKRSMCAKSCDLCQHSNPKNSPKGNPKGNPGVVKTPQGNKDCSRNKYADECLSRTCADPREKLVQKCQDYCNGRGRNRPECNKPIDAECKPDKYAEICLSTTCEQQSEKTTQQCTKSALEAPFQGTFPTETIHFDLTIGTKGQKINVKVPFQGADTELFVTKTAFDSTKSSSFVKVGDGANADDFSGPINLGTDTFVLNGAILKSKQIAIKEKNAKDGTTDQTNGLLYIGRQTQNVRTCQQTQDCVGFIQSVLRDKTEKVLVFAFDEIKMDTKYTGQLILGDKASALCDSNWFYVPEVQSRSFPGANWFVEITDFLVKSAGIPNPGQMSINFDSKNYALPPAVYDKVMQELGADPNGLIECDTQDPLTIKLGNKALNILPQSYINLGTKQGTKCQTLLAKNSRDDFEFPLIQFSKVCLLFDYGTTPQIGIARRL